MTTVLLKLLLTVNFVGFIATASLWHVSMIISHLEVVGDELK